MNKPCPRMSKEKMREYASTKETNLPKKKGYYTSKR